MIIEFSEQIEDAVDAILEDGIVGVEGTKTIAVKLIRLIKAELEFHDEIVPIESYKNVPNHGYLYYVYDSNKFLIGSTELEKLILKIDAED